MNNSQIQLENNSNPGEEIAERLGAEEARLLKIIEATQGVQQMKEWSTLKTEVFDSLVNVLEKDIRFEAKKEDPNSNKLNRLAGELKWAEKYSDLSRLEGTYRVQLQAVRIKLHVKTE